MKKPSRAKVKKLQSEAMRAGAQRRAAKSQSRSDSNCAVTRGEVDLDSYAEVDAQWREIGLAAPARRALVDEGLFALSDLRKVSLAALKDLHGMGPNAIRILVAEMKKKDIQFRN
jgi:hypothetical protein